MDTSWTRRLFRRFGVYGNNWHMISAIVTTRTSTQIRTHAQKYHESLLPDSRACMLTNNAEALRKYQESLSTDTKACMLKIHAKEQKIYLEYFSPNTKAFIQESNTIAHQKRQESLSPNTKARTKEINTIAHWKPRHSPLYHRHFIDCNHHHIKHCLYYTQK